DRLAAAGARRILVVPMYPQYAASTTASVADAVAAWTLRRRNLPELRYVRAFAGDAGYIRALRDAVERHWTAHGRPDRLVMSFHGLPRRALTLGDPYHCECRKTGRLLAEALGMPADRCLVTFQSRFGRAEWLQPYTQPTLEALAREGVGRVDVVCPGFVADCLETLEEIAIECKAAFLSAGGREFRYIPCLNEDDAWISALADLAETHLQGWPDQVPGDPAAATRARALGAAT
ncbi:MAG: ferrochelatase, partial [Rhodocyclaceae bacterium]|nr:ferrochelatase [Rhodocyclaceae bacterium]